MAPRPKRADLQAAAARRFGGGRRPVTAARRSSSSEWTKLDVGGVGPVSSLPLPVAVSGRRDRRLDSSIVILMDRCATDDSAQSVEFIAPESEPVNIPVQLRLYT